MAADILLKESAVSTLAARIGDKSKDFDNMIIALDKLVDSLDGQWTGTSYDMFVDKYRALRPKLNKIKSAFGIYERAIKTAMQKTVETDHEYATTVGRIYGDIAIKATTYAPALPSVYTLSTLATSTIHELPNPFEKVAEVTRDYGQRLKWRIVNEYDWHSVPVRRDLIESIVDSTDSPDELKSKLDALFYSARDEIMRRWRNKERVDTSAFERKYTYKNKAGKNVGFYVQSNGCTWYAVSRYRQVNGIENDLVFARAGGDAKAFDDNIDKDLFEVVDIPEEGFDYSLLRSNSLAVSDVKDHKASGNHVVYIEAIIDGYVYYTDGAWKKPESSYGYMKRKKVEDFCKIYEHIIYAKQQQDQYD